MDFNTKNLNVILEQTNNFVYLSDIETYELIYINKYGLDTLGLEEKDVVGKKCYEVLQDCKEPCEFCTNNRISLDTLYVWKRYNPNINRYYEMYDKLVRLEDNRVVRMEVASDITDSELARLDLKRKLEMEKTLIECIHTLSAYDDQHKAIEKLLGIVSEYYHGKRGYIFEFDYKNETLSNTYEYCAKGISKEKQNLQGLPLSYVDSWVKQFQLRGEFFLSSVNKNLDKDSDQYKILNPQNIESLIAAPLIEDDTIAGFIGIDDPEVNTDDLSLLTSVSYFILNDIQKRRTDQRIQKMIYTDMLTGVYNRNMYIKTLEQLSVSKPENCGALFIDINGLKPLNDKFGHEYGDVIIKRLGTILSAVFGDSAFRIGGDEFVVICTNVSKAAFEKKIEKLYAAVADNPDLDISAGYDWCEKANDINAMISYADRMMYSEKQSYYDRNITRDYNRRTYVSKKILGDIQAGVYEVYLQPQFNLADSSIVGAEALIRKHAADGSIVLPVKFIPQLENERSVYYLDLFVVEKMCQRLKRWAEEGRKIDKISVNVSKVTLTYPGITRILASQCEKYGVVTSKLCLEITESATISKTDGIEKVMNELLALGFRVSMDDFGEQCSNMSVLIDIEFNELKLDRSIISRALVNDRAKQVIVHTIDICKAFDNTLVIAEGVESQKHLDYLRQAGVKVGQGFYFSPPIPIKEFEDKFLPLG